MGVGNIRIRGNDLPLILFPIGSFGILAEAPLLKV